MAWQRNASDVSRLYCEATLWAMFQNASRRSRKTAQAEPIIVYATHERKHPYAARLQRYAATVPLLLFVAGLLSTFQALAAAPATQRLDTWLSMVRQTPYWASRGVAANLKVIRRWVLLGESYCAGPPRHLLFDHRGRFLGYIDDGATPQDTTVRLNRVRERLARAGRVAYWSPGAQARVGYPFALACHQPFVDMEQTIARMSGAREEYRLWGTWDGMRIGEPDRQVSLVQLIREVFHYRQHQGRYTFPEPLLRGLLGQIMIESGGNKNALSTRAAQGIMQLSSEVLDDCNIPETFRRHRVAQIDCALRLIQQNHRNLMEPFMAVFGHLPATKRDTLYGLLLAQAYQIGVERSVELLQEPELGNAARFLAAHHWHFSAEDIVVGMIYHNLGRKDLGLRSLFYGIDARIAAEALCSAASMTDDPWCAH
jgi:hypothetical protein